MNQEDKYSNEASLLGERKPKGPGKRRVVAFSSTFNNIVGTGVFGLPYAFYRAGIFLGLILFSFYWLILTITALWILEIICRANGVLEEQATKTKQPNNQITSKPMTYSKFVKIFCGKKAAIATRVLLALNTFATLWSYASIFASIISSLFFQLFANGEACNVYLNPSFLCSFSYSCFIVLLFAITFMLTLFNFDSIDFGVAFYQIFSTLFMLITIWIALGKSHPLTFDPNNFSTPEAFSFKLSGFSLVFSMASVCLSVHSAIPMTVSPIRNKARVRNILLAALGISCFVYVLLAFFGGWYFNEKTEPLFILNWEDYTSEGGGWGPSSHVSAWATISKIVVMLFPLIMVVNEMPTLANVLGENLDSIVPDSLKTTARGERIWHVIMRLFSLIPPILAGALYGNMEIIYTISGMTSFIVVFFIPCILEIISQNYMQKNYGAKYVKTPYSGWYSNRVLVYIISAIGVLSFLLAFVLIFLNSTLKDAGL